MSEEEFYNKLKYNFFGTIDCKDFKELVKAYNDKDKEIERLHSIINEARDYNRKLTKLYDIGTMERSNADTNLVILEDKETIDKLKELKDNDYSKIEEDKKIEKLKKKEEIVGIVDGTTYKDKVYNLEDIGNKINEIIDYLNKENK